MNEEQEYNSQPYGDVDDKVHFDPIRAVQSIKLSNNYRTARSNDNFLSTVILNTYFFNNAVLHHHEIQQPPPKLPYDADISYISSDSNASDSSDPSLSDSNQSLSSCNCSTSSSNSNNNNNNNPLNNPDTYDDIKIEQKHPHPAASTSANNLHNIHTIDTNPDYNNGNYTLQNTQSMRYKFNNKFRKKKIINNNSLSDLHHALSTPNKAHKRNTISTICYVPSKAKHKANPNKASQILGINSEAVIFANNNRKKKRFTHRKSNSFSETLRNANIKNIKEKKQDEDMDADVVMEDDEFMIKQLEFDKFQAYKRNSGTSTRQKNKSRSQTMDFSNCTVKNKENENINKITINQSKTNIKPLHMHSQHYSTNNMHNINNMQVKQIKKRRNGHRNGESDVIEIKFKIDHTKKGYLFVGVIPASKINNVVQPGFMFGFNEYSYALHGYCGKLYHDKIQNDYCFTPNNLSNNNKQQKHKQKQQRMNRANTVDITQGISGISGIVEDDIKRNESKSLVDGSGCHKKLPVLQSGDVVTLKMKLNRNNGKFAVIFCINNIDYGIAWKGIDPPVTIGVTMVGRKEQITLLSCSYKPYKNDKSCVIL